MADARPDISTFFGAFGVPAIVTHPGGVPITTTAMWHGGAGVAFPDGGALAVTELRRAISLRKDHVGAVQTGTIVNAPERANGTPVDWTVDGIALEDDEVVRVFVV
jgi:hypothetical protein